VRELAGQLIESLTGQPPGEPPAFRQG